MKGEKQNDSRNGSEIENMEVKCEKKTSIRKEGQERCPAHGPPAEHSNGIGTYCIITQRRAVLYLPIDHRQTEANHM